VNIILKTNILIVEDNPGDSRLLREQIADTGGGHFEVAEADRLAQAREMLREHAFDLLLLDLGLPDSRGLDTFRAIRGDAGDAAVLILTGLDDDQLAAQAVKEGAQDYLIKGQLTARGLLRAMRHALERKELEVALRQAKSGLERIVSERTTELIQTNRELNAEIVGRQRTEADLQAALTQTNLIFENAVVGIAYVRNRLMVRANPRFCEMFGYTHEAIVDRSTEMFYPGREAFDALGAVAYPVLAQGQTYQAEIQFKRSDGSIFWGNLHGRSVNPREPESQSIWVFEDITERKRSEEALLRVNRALKTLSKCNEALVHATAEAQLLGEMCRICVEIGGYRMAWVGFAEHGADKAVRPVAHFGHEHVYLERAAITWEDSERGRGPTGAAIREGKAQLVSDTATDPRYASWRTDAVRRGYGSTMALPLLSDGRAFGALNIYAGERNAFDEQEIALLEELASDLAFGIVTLRMRGVHAKNAERLQRSMESTVQTIAATVEMRDPYTAGHQNRVAELAAAIAREMGLPQSQIHGLHLASIVHDLGKIQIPAELLSKPTRLTQIEYEIIKTHAQSGYEILKDVDFPWPIAEIVRQHHERLDGSGYPQGLKADDILIEAKILAVADTIEAMGAARPYRPAVGIEVALQEVSRGRGTQYDSRVVDACLQLFREKRFVLTEPPEAART